jgi:hypothetical protein
MPLVLSLMVVFSVVVIASMFLIPRRAQKSAKVRHFGRS